LGKKLGSTGRGHGNKLARERKTYNPTSSLPSSSSQQLEIEFSGAEKPYLGALPILFYQLPCARDQIWVSDLLLVLFYLTVVAQRFNSLPRKVYRRDGSRSKSK
jgi:hypothetical protein